VEETERKKQMEETEGRVRWERHHIGGETERKREGKKGKRQRGRGEETEGNRPRR
jgi:hypothetical protein